MLDQAGMASEGARVLVVGVAFKPGVQDTRDSTATDIVGDLRSAGCEVACYDPMVKTFAVAGVDVPAAGPDTREVDMVIVHTVHHDTDMTPVHDAPLLLDCTY